MTRESIIRIAIAAGIIVIVKRILEKSGLLMPFSIPDWVIGFSVGLAFAVIFIGTIDYYWLGGKLNGGKYYYGKK